jgi:hypothetical protein
MTSYTSNQANKMPKSMLVIKHIETDKKVIMEIQSYDQIPHKRSMKHMQAMLSIEDPRK